MDRSAQAEHTNMNVSRARELVQRRPSPAHAFWIRAVIKQEASYIGLEIDNRDNHNTAAPLIGRRVVRIGSCVKQRANRFEMALPDGEHQWRHRCTYGPLRDDRRRSPTYQIWPGLAGQWHAHLSRRRPR